MFDLIWRSYLRWLRILSDDFWHTYLWKFFVLELKKNIFYLLFFPSRFIWNYLYKACAKVNGYQIEIADELIFSFFAVASTLHTYLEIRNVTSTCSVFTSFSICLRGVKCQTFARLLLRKFCGSRVWYATKAGCLHHCVSNYYLSFLTQLSVSVCQFFHNLQKMICLHRAFWRKIYSVIFLATTDQCNWWNNSKSSQILL